MLMPFRFSRSSRHDWCEVFRPCLLYLKHFPSNTFFVFIQMSQNNFPTTLSELISMIHHSLSTSPAFSRYLRLLMVYIDIYIYMLIVLPRSYATSIWVLFCCLHCAYKEYMTQCRYSILTKWRIAALTNVVLSLITCV